MSYACRVVGCQQVALKVRNKTIVVLMKEVKKFAAEKQMVDKELAQL